MTLSRSSISSTFSTFLSLIITIPLVFLLVSCTEDPDDPVQFKPTSTINKLFIVGSQIDNGDLVLYVNGTDTDGTPFTVSDLQAISVDIGDEPNAQTYTNDGTNVSIGAVAPGDKILSLTFLSDYSGSIPETEFDVLRGIHNNILDALPSIYEIQVFIFSDDPKMKLDWTESDTDPTSAASLAIRNAVEVETVIWKNGTALLDGLGEVLLRSQTGDPSDGLIQRCRPARMLIVFSDGLENASTLHTDQQTLVNYLEQNNVLTIMLGGESADLATLNALAGNLGAVVQMSNASAIDAQITNWKDSLSNMVSIRIKPDTLYDTVDTVTLRVNAGQELVFDTATVGGVCP